MQPLTSQKGSACKVHPLPLVLPGNLVAQVDPGNILAVVDIHLDLEAGSLVGLVVGSLAAPAAGSPAGADSPVGPVADSPAVVGNLAVEEAAGIAEVAAADNLAAEAAAAAADSLVAEVAHIQRTFFSRNSEMQCRVLGRAFVK